MSGEFQRQFDRANAVAEWAGCEGFPDPTGERYVYAAGTREEEPTDGIHHYALLGKKSESAAHMEEWFEALERIFFANERAPA